MKLTIVAATGGVGRQILEQARAAGHDVTAVVRNPGKLPSGVRSVRADLATAAAVDLAPAVADADAVLSGLGATSNSAAGVGWRGTRAVVEAMQLTQARRLVVVSAAPIGTVRSPGNPNPPKYDPGDGFFMRHLFSHVAKTAFRKQYGDLALLEDVIRGSGLEWTVVRPPKLTDKRLTGSYRTAYGQNLRGGWSVSRADVADYMLRVIDQPETIKQFMGIAD